MSKKKLIITITSLCLVVVAAVAAVVGVVAASTQTVRSTVNVTYTANNVKATVGVMSKLQYDSNYGENRGTATSIQFYATDAARTENLQVSPAVALGQSKGLADETVDNWAFERYVIYRYSFHNDYATDSGEGRTIGRSMRVTLTYTPTNNVTQSNSFIVFATQAGNDTTAPVVTDNENRIGNESHDLVVTADNWKSATVAGTTSEYSAYSTPLSIEVDNNETGYFYVLIGISDPTREMSFSNTAPAFVFVLQTINPTQNNG